MLRALFTKFAFVAVNASSPRPWSAQYFAMLIPRHELAA
jgi:hypothetical protein